MKKRSSATARILAVIALAAGVVALIVVVSANVGGGSSSSKHNGQQSHTQNANHEEKTEKKVPATYTIQTEDTLTKIAHETGVPVGKIERLNPEIDPQLLIAGEQIKLK